LIWFVLLPGLPLVFPVLLPLVALLFFHFAGGLHGLAKTLTFGFMAMACLAELQAVPQLLFPESSTPRRIIDSPACPLTVSSAQKSVASADVILLSTHWLLAPKPDMVWYVVPELTAQVPALIAAVKDMMTAITSNSFLTTPLIFIPIVFSF
jgi:hypothetical protein